ncbi:MAG: LysR family transcriptional regulator [Hyphomicrobiales bacterium]|nr:LysR family transcriptional regulator [Hyphomicrobiales bacterium]
MNNLRHLKYIVEAARHGSITQASRQLLVSQPAISAAVRACEEEFGTRIFIRTPSRGLALTPTGKTFIKRARELLEDAEDFHNLFTEAKDGPLAGRIELACYASPAPLLVPRVIHAFSENHPQVDIGLHEGNMEQVAAYLKNGIADLALTYDMFLDNDVEFDAIARITPFAIMSAKNPLAKRERLSLAELADAPFILLDSPGYREFFYNYFGIYNLRPNIAYRPSTFELVRGLLTNGAGYSMSLIKIKNRQAYDNSRLANVELADPAPNVNLVLAYLKGYRQSRVVRAFADICKARLSEVRTGVPTP